MACESPSTRFVEKHLGKMPHFIMCMMLEWVMIISLFLDGVLTFFTAEFAKYFGMEIPCWLCGRMNHILAHKTPDFYYNNSICEAHKKDVSSLAFCHNHKKLSEIRKMCESCLLSFAIQKESDCETYKSLVGVLNKNLECFVEDDENMQLSLKDDDGVSQVEKINTQRCCCCGAPLKAKTSSSKLKKSGSFLRAPAASPRAPPYMTSRTRGLDSPRFLYTENDSELPHNEDGNILKNHSIKLKEEAKGASWPSLTEGEDINIDSPKTPPFPWSNRFFGSPFTDSPSNSPRRSSMIIKKSPLEKTEFASESNIEGKSNSPRWSSMIIKKSPLEKTELAFESNIEGNTKEDAILNNLKMQVRLDRKSLMALYMELDEERSASAVAANNAMAMITRLQEEKASMQMDASQYHRMMEEQIEYDEEVLQETNDLLIKLEEEVKTLETELEIYRDKYGYLTEGDFKAHVDNTPPRPTEGKYNGENDLSLHQAVSSKAENGGGKLNDTLKDFRMEKTYLLGQMKKMENSNVSAGDGS